MLRVIGLAPFCATGLRGSSSIFLVASLLAGCGEVVVMEGMFNASANGFCVNSVALGDINGSSSSALDCGFGSVRVGSDASILACKL